jgi:uncharacterized UBP type Zn finger protein
MFVRWKKRSGVRGTSIYCYLCHSQRIDGKVATKTLGYLGSIAPNPTKLERSIFWQQVVASLNQRINLSTADRAKIEAALAQKVPRGETQDADAVQPFPSQVGGCGT